MLFADDTVLLAEKAVDMKRNLQCLQSWCEERSVEINVEKSVMMHMRKRRVRKQIDAQLTSRLTWMKSPGFPLISI